MTGKPVSKVSAEVKALRIVLITLLILYGLIFVSALVFMATVFPSFVGLSAGAGFWADLRIFLGKVLTGPIYFFIAYHIFRLISLISRGEPFSPASPRHIRRIGYAVLGLTVINAIVNGIYEFTSPGAYVSEAILRILYNSLTTVLLGFGFLVIARVFEAGVRLQQDQNLTV